jgi:hypothetical protein
MHETSTRSPLMEALRTLGPSAESVAPDLVLLGGTSIGVYERGGNSHDELVETICAILPPERRRTGIERDGITVQCSPPRLTVNEVRRPRDEVDREMMGREAEVLRCARGDGDGWVTLLTDGQGSVVGVETAGTLQGEAARACVEVAFRGLQLSARSGPFPMRATRRFGPPPPSEPAAGSPSKRGSEISRALRELWGRCSGPGASITRIEVAVDGSGRVPDVRLHTAEVASRRAACIDEATRTARLPRPARVPYTMQLNGRY